MDKVIGVGLCKTGTKTLKFALMELGFKNPKKCKQKYTTWYKNGEYHKLHEVARKANNISDLPWALMYTELDYWFDDLYYVLTVRKNADVWFGSVMNHIATRGMSNLNFQNIFGMSTDSVDEKRLKKFYLDHNRKVRDYFKGNRRFTEVCWEKGDGWPELCAGLDLPIPFKDFPWENNSKK